MGGIGGGWLCRARSALLRSIGRRHGWGRAGRPRFSAMWRRVIRRRVLAGGVRGRRAGFLTGAIAPARTGRALPVAWIAIVGWFVPARVGRQGLRAAWAPIGGATLAIVRRLLGRGFPDVAGRRELRLAGVRIRDHAPGVAGRWGLRELRPAGVRIRGHTPGIVRWRRQRLLAAAVGRAAALGLGRGEIIPYRLGRLELGVDEPWIVRQGSRYFCQ